MKDLQLLFAFLELANLASLGVAIGSDCVHLHSLFRALREVLFRNDMNLIKGIPIAEMLSEAVLTASAAHTSRDRTSQWPSVS